jgi:sRNA-binding protein
VPELSPAACAARLAELFPALFKGQPKPLKLRIQADIQQRAPGVFTKKSLSAFLHRHTTTTAYLVALSQAAQRVDLDGAPAGELTEEHTQAALTELARRRAMHEERRAADLAARRAVEGQARQARAAEDEARRERAMLLRAFETSTLTRANFCALKRIAEPELDVLLVTARQEAAQRAQDGWQERPHDRANDSRDDRPHDRPRHGPHDRPRGGRPPDPRGAPRPAGGAGARPAQEHRTGPRPAGKPPASPKPQR